jgi:hypothetical protein
VDVTLRPTRSKGIAKSPSRRRLAKPPYNRRPLVTLLTK